MEKRTSWVMLGAIVLTAGRAAAQPSDAQVKKDMSGPTVLQVRLTDKPGTVQANTDTLNYEFVRGVEILEKTDMPGVKVLVIGDAVYQRVAGGKFKYWKFRLIENRYEGIPNPKPEEIMEVLARDRTKQFGGGLENVILKVHEGPTLAAEPRWEWHTPNSVSFTMTAKIDMVKSYTEFETFEQDLRVRLYRDDLKQPWKTYMSTADKRRSLGRTTLPAAELKRMPRLLHQHQEAAAKADAAKLPAVTVPEFKDHAELILYVHRALRDGPPERAEAVLLAVLSPRFFADGSTVLLNGRGAEIVNGAVERAFKGRATYAQQYCADPAVDTQQSQGTRMYLLAAINRLNTMMAAERTGGAYKDGVKVGEQWKLSELQVRVREDDDAIQFVSSFTDRSKLCPRDGAR